MKKIFLFISLLLATTNLMAEPIGEKRAREIATEFLSQKMTRTTISNLQLEWAGDDIVNITRAGSDLDNSLMYIYNSAESKSFVIVGGDTNADFVLAYSLNNTFDMENMADGAKDILSAWCRQIEDARKNNKPINIARQSTRTNDARLYETANWSQSEPYNRKAPTINNKRSVTGCVATAMSILCYYYKWPNNGVGTTPEYTYIDVIEGLSHTIPANELDHTYEYDKMIMSYDGVKKNYTEEQGDAVATLMKDMGTAVMMRYHPDGSAADSPDVVSAFMNYFGYSKNTTLAYGEDYSYDEWTNLIRETLRNYGPTYFSGVSHAEGGHAFVVDGYDENNYFHFNFGWNGYDNGYYTLPDHRFYYKQDALLYLEPDKDGTSQYPAQIDLYWLSKLNYDLDAYYNENKLNINSMRMENNSPAVFNGTVKVVLCDKHGSWKNELYTQDYSIEAGDTWQCIPSISVDKASLNLAEGDRIRVYYKVENSDEWKRMVYNHTERRLLYDDTEILVMASPEDLAEGLLFSYDKTTQIMTLENIHPTKVDIYWHEENVQATSPELIEAAQPYGVTMPEDGTFRIEISLGSDPYELILKL